MSIVKKILFVELIIVLKLVYFIRIGLLEFQYYRGAAVPKFILWRILGDKIRVGLSLLGLGDSWKGVCRR